MYHLVSFICILLGLLPVYAEGVGLPPPFTTTSTTTTTTERPPPPGPSNYDHFITFRFNATYASNITLITSDLQVEVNSRFLVYPCSEPYREAIAWRLNYWIKELLKTKKVECGLVPPPVSFEILSQLKKLYDPVDLPEYDYDYSDTEAAPEQSTTVKHQIPSTSMTAKYQFPSTRKVPKPLSVYVAYRPPVNRKIVYVAQRKVTTLRPRTPFRKMNLQVTNNTISPSVTLVEH